MGSYGSDLEFIVVFTLKALAITGIGTALLAASAYIADVIDRKAQKQKKESGK